MAVENQANISGGSVQGFIQENHGTVNQYFISQISDLISSSALETENPLTQIEYRQRKVLLSKVKEYWVQGVLEKSLHTDVMIELDLERRLDAVQRPFEDLGELSAESRQILPAKTGVAEIFSQIGEGRTLLILGEPGAGKTVALLKLAQNLVARAEENLSRLIPVVFNLSSWGSKESTIDNWLVEELFSKYQVPKEVGKKWIKDQQLVLLLDGLDEVNASRQEACVEAINQFTQKYFLTEMVVCSRIVDYELLSNRLKLRGAIYIRSLTPEQVNQYLENAGEQLEGVKSLLREDTALQELAKSPLTLSIITLAYSGKEAQELPHAGSLEVHRQYLFNAYIDRMFKRKRVNQQYPKDKTVQWLAWLAKRMSQTSQSMFLIEQMQPSWLQSKIENIFYRLGTILCGTLFIGLILLLGMALDLDNRYLNHANVLMLNVVAWGLVLFGYFGIGEVEITTFETLTWPWKKTRKELLSGLGRGLMWSLVLAPFAILWCILSCQIGDTSVNIFASLILGLILGLIIGIIHAVKGSEIETKTVPNQGIRRTARNAGITVVVCWLLLSLIIFNWFPPGLQSMTSIMTWGIILGLLFGGGIAVIQHYSLRSLLWIKGFLPFNLVRLLDYSSERIFLQKVGGGYIFVHRMLLEHFAGMK
jgi:hypothetical protein